MPASNPSRKLIHTRETIFTSYRREDGLMDLEAHLTDKKPETFTHPNGMSWKAGDPIHDMWIRLTVNNQLQILDIAAKINSHPLDECPESILDIKKLIGFNIGRGWRKVIEEQLGGIKGCTHIRQLLFNIANAAFQSISAEIALTNPDVAPHFLDTCHGWDSKGPSVLKFYPKFYKAD